MAQPDGEHQVPEHALRHRANVMIVSHISRVLVALFKYGALASIPICAYLSINTLAGKETMADIGVRLFSDVRVSEAVAYATAALTGTGWFREWRQRRRSVQIADRNAKLEQQINPNRTSSNLTITGDTNPEDLYDI